MTEMAPRTMRAGRPQPHDAADRARLRVVLLAALALIVLMATCASIGRGPWDPDELRYADVVQSMRAGGDLFVPHLWGRIYTDKPPLFFWLVRMAAAVFGNVGLPALLAPIVLSSWAGVWLVSRIAYRWYGPRTAAIAAVMLVTLPSYLLLSQIGRMDMLLAVAITAAMHLFYIGYVEGRTAAQVGSFAMMGVGLLAKGPFGVLFPLAVGAVFLMIARRLRRLWCIGTLLGALALAGVVAVWLVPAVATEGWGYIDTLIRKQVVNRAVEGTDHKGPFYFYLMILPACVMPWVVFLWSAVRASWRRWRDERDERDLWLLCWMIVPLVILSLVREKLAVYLLPALFPIVIVVAREWSSLDLSRARASRDGWQVIPMFAATCLAAVVLMAIGGRWARPALATSFVWGGVILLAMGFIGVLLCWRDSPTRLRRGFALLASLGPAGCVFIALVSLPAFDAVHSWRLVGAAAAESHRPGEIIVTFRVRPFVGYYLHQFVDRCDKPNEVAELVERHGAVRVVMRVVDLEKLEHVGVVERTQEGPWATPRGPVCVVRLRRLDVAAAPADTARDRIRDSSGTDVPIGRSRRRRVD